MMKVRKERRKLKKKNPRQKDKWNEQIQIETRKLRKINSDDWRNKKKQKKRKEKKIMKVETDEIFHD